MIKGKTKYYFLLAASIAGLCCLAVSYAVPGLVDAATGNTTGTPTSGGGDSSAAKQPADTKAYDDLTTAQGKADESNTAADDTRKNKPDKFLDQIADNTYAFLKAFNYYSLNWLQIYTTPTSTKLDSLFEKYTTSTQSNSTEQLSLLNGTLYSFNDPEKKIESITAPGADANYASLVKQNSTDEATGEPKEVDKTIKTNALLFVRKASGISIPHISPNDMIAGTDVFAIKKYNNFYDTVNAVASYNAYVLNEHLADVRNNFKLTHTQLELKSYASNKDWLDHVNAEKSIGVILRQLLLFTSQMYVVSLQSLETQKQILAAIAMTNSLVILGNGTYEKTIYNEATKK